MGRVGPGDNLQDDFEKGAAAGVGRYRLNEGKKMPQTDPIMRDGPEIN
jgi:hypothetical protein